MIRPILWVPQSATFEAAQSPTSYPFIAVTGSYEVLFEVRPSWEDLVDRLHCYDLGTILDILARMGSALANVGGGSRQEFQLQACRGLFGDRANQVIERTESFQRTLADEGTDTPLILFHQLQILNLAKVALIELSAEGEHGDDDLYALGEALLMMGDLAEPRIDEGEGEDDRMTLNLEYYAVTNSLFHHTPNQMHAMARAFDLYFSDKPQLAEHPHYLDLPSRVQRSTGLVAEQAWTAMFALTAHWGRITPENIAERSGFIDRDTYFTSQLDLTPTESENIFELLTVPIDQLQESIQERYSPDDLRWFDFLPFARYPLVDLDGRVYALSRTLLLEKLTIGLHHVHLNPSVFASQERQAYLTYTGAVVEDYVDRVFRRAYPPVTGRYLPGSELESKLEQGKIADGIILYGGSAVVIEVKASLLTAEARGGGDWTAYEARMGDLFVDGLTQAYDTINSIESGSLSPPGWPSSVSEYFPVIVTLEPIVMWPLVYDRISARVAEVIGEPPASARPWQHLTIDDLEFVEVAVDSGRSFEGLLREKTADPFSVGESFTNYCIRTGEAAVTSGANPHLATIWQRLGSEATAWARSRSREEPRGT